MRPSYTIGEELTRHGIEWKMVRRNGEEQYFAPGIYEDGDFVEFRVNHILDGTPIRFDRRRYGQSATYTWAHALVNGHWQRLWFGDAWPAINPPASELRKAIEEARKVVAAGGVQAYIAALA